MQYSFYIRCDQFPLISDVNGTDLQCARLRTLENNQPAEPDLDKPSQLALFAIVDVAAVQATAVNLQLSFHQSSVSPSSINEIYLSLLVTRSTFVINNQTSVVYAPYNLLTFHWRAANESAFELIDELPLAQHDFETDRSLCQWDDSRWNHLFHGNASTNVSYVYFLKTSQTQFAFTLIDTSNDSTAPPAPDPYLSVLYCLPYRLGTTEIVLIVLFGVTFVAAVAVLSVLHFFKVDDTDRALQLERTYQHHTSTSSTARPSQTVRQRASAATSTGEQDDRTRY